ncbi:hypothetical protein RJ639_042527 [Escallonia herrerae]|uniref:Protein-tyrosine-phosphatase MKP1 n=1 Tax=Escallonia herrerae TaxID=1293975 RepID=A0AA88WI55_9ASTE|nr:hypothetical protein RJ639_042527 [Escallonia herrerae]
MLSRLSIEPGEEDKGSWASNGNRKLYSRSVSLTERSPTRPISRPVSNVKGRACLPPLMPLSISRPKAEEWPRAGSDDLGVWPNAPCTPGARSGPSKIFGNSDAEQPPREFEFKKDKLAFFDKECSKIMDHVYLGSDAVAKNREILRQNGVTHVLNCVGFVCPEYFKNDLVYKTLWLQDSPSEDITSILYDVFDYFEDVREQGGRVLVHCCQGVSRSTSLVIAYLMWRERQSFEDAFQHVKATRGVTNPNMGFACQLLQCQKRVHAVPASPNSVLRMYRMAPHSSYDPLHLVPKMLNQPSMHGLDSRGAFIVHVPSAIYVWIGQNCTSVMSGSAKAAAFQVIQYERAQGPLVTIKEGEEPSEFWTAIGNGQFLADGSRQANTKEEEEGLAAANDMIAAATHANIVQRKVGDYDLDFELFHKALDGGVVPAFALSGNESETCLPARQNGWGKLRHKFASGIMKEFIMSSKLGGDASHSSHGPGMSMGTCKEVELPISPSDSSLPSTPQSDSPDSFSSFVTRAPLWTSTCKELVNSVPLPDPLESLTHQSSSPDSFSRYMADNSKFNSLSPSISPSTSDHSNSFTFSPSSSNWSDLSYLSAQPSPSALEYRDPCPAKNVKLAVSKGFICKETFGSSEEAFSANHALRNTCVSCRGTSPSIAERRGSNPPPRMVLPSVDDASQVPPKLTRSWSFSLLEPDSEDDIMTDVECNQFEKEELMLDEDCVTANGQFQNGMNDDEDYDTCQLPTGDKTNRVAEVTGFVLYQWPAMDEVEMRYFDILDSRSVYVMFVPDSSFVAHGPLLYIWVGREVSCEKDQRQMIPDEGACKDNHIQWETVGHNLLTQKGLATNSLVQIVKEGEEPEQLLKHLRYLSVQKASDTGHN